MLRKLTLTKLLILLVSSLLISSLAFAQNNEIDDLIEKLGQNDFRASMTLQRLGVEAIPALEQTLTDPDYPNHLNVIFVLERMGLEEAIPALKLGLGFGPRVREAAVNALVKFQNLTVGELAAELLTEEQDYQLGVASLIAATKQDRVEIIQLLLANLNFTDSRVVITERVANVIATVYVEQASQTRTALLDLLREQAESEQPVERSLAYQSYLRMAQLARGLGTFQDVAPYSVASQLIDCLLQEDEIGYNQLLAAETLAMIAPNQAATIQVFADLIADSQVDSELLKSAVNGLEKAGVLAKEYVPQLLAAVTYLPEESQWRLARVFVESGKVDPSVVQLVVDSFANADFQEQAFYYVRVLGAIGSEASLAKAQLEEALSQTQDLQLIAAIERALEQIGA